MRFVEKPKDAALLEGLKLKSGLLSSIGADADEELYQASMGIYVFNRDVLVDCLANDLVDFGKHIIPQAIKERRVSAYIFNGYWEDIGTIRAFYEANLDLTDILPQYSFFEASAPIYTHPRFLPGSKINGATLRQAIIADGCIISDAHIERSVIGVRSTINTGATIRNSIVMGADYYEMDSDLARARGMPPIGIGAQLRDRSRDHRQERADRRRRRDHAGRQAGGRRCGELLHPRRHRRGAEERRDPGRDVDLAGVTAAHPLGHAAELPLAFPFLLLVPRQRGFAAAGGDRDQCGLLLLSRRKRAPRRRRRAEKRCRCAKAKGITNSSQHK